MRGRMLDAIADAVMRCSIVRTGLHAERHVLWPARVLSVPVVRHIQPAARRLSASAALSPMMEESTGFDHNPPPDSVPNVQIREVDFDPRLVNSVGVLGNLGQPFSLRRLPNGMCVGSSTLAVRNAKRETDWFNLEVWNGLAELAATELQKGTQVQVVGRLKTETWTDKEGQPRKSFKIVADQVNRVRPYMAQGQGYGGPPPPLARMEPPVQQPASGGITEQQGQEREQFGQPQNFYDELPAPSQALGPAEQKWVAFFQDPNAYYDNRTSKRNPRAPDFKAKDGDAALWLDSRDTPPWVQPQLAKAGLGKDPSWDEDIPF